MAYISRKHPQFPTSSVSRMMPLAKGMVGNIVNEDNWVRNVFSCPWISQWFLARHTWLRLSGGAAGMQGIHKNYRNVLNLHVNCHGINCNFYQLTEFNLFVCV